MQSKSMRTRTAGGVCFTVVLALVASLPASHGQTPTRDEPFPVLEDARRWGPFMVDLEFVIHNIGYDNNVFLVPDTNFDGSPTTKETDFIVRLGPEIHAQTSFGHRFALTVHDELGGEIFFSHSDLNHIDNMFSGQFDALFGPLLLTAEAKWDSREFRPSSEFDERTRLKTLELEGRGRVFLGPKTDIVFKAKESQFRYEDNDSSYFLDLDGDGTPEAHPIGDALNRDTQTLSAEIGWRPLGKTRFLLEVRRREDRFTERPFDADYEETRISLGLEFRPTAYLSGKILFGRSKLDSIDPASTKIPFDGIVSDTQLVYKPTRRTKVYLDYEVDAQFSVFEDSVYFEELYKGLRLETYLGSVWGIQAGYSLKNLDWPEVASQIGVPRADEITDVFGGILLNMRSGLILGMRLGVRDRTSNIDFAEDRQAYFSTTGSFAF